MPKITEKRRQAQRARIIAAAQTCFLRRGIHPTSMQDIIQESGLSTGAVYGYFASKDELIIASITTSMDAVVTVIDPIVAAPPAGGVFAALKAIWEGVGAFSRESGVDYGRLALLGLAEAQNDDIIRAHLQERYQVLMARFADLAGQYDSAANPQQLGRLAFVLIFGMNAAHSLFGPEAGFDTDVIAFLQGQKAGDA